VSSERLPPILDLEHLVRQTFADRELEQEILLLFDAQCARLLPVIARSPERRERADGAHTLTGAARAVGAERLASLAAAIEAGESTGAVSMSNGRLLAELQGAVDETRAAVAARLAEPNGDARQAAHSPRWAGSPKGAP